MKYGVLVVNNALLNNKVFDKDDPIINRDSCMTHYWQLREAFRVRGIELVTQDKCSEKPLFYLFDDLPRRGTFGINPDITKYGLPMDVPQYLILWECELISGVWPSLDIMDFEKVFSWFHWWNHKKAMRVYWPQQITPMYQGPKSKFLCIISNHKSSQHYRELYSERLRAIEYFGDKIDVYGNTYKSNPPSKIIPNKLEVLKDYRFSICYENARDIPGYTTEKIFDCFKAGVVPVYIGNAECVPYDCYINKEEFTYPQLEQYLTNMSKRRYAVYQDNIRKYLDCTPYNADFWVNTIVKTILG